MGGVMSASALERRRARLEMGWKLEPAPAWFPHQWAREDSWVLQTVRPLRLSAAARRQDVHRHNKCVQAQPWLPALAPRLQSTALAGSAGTCSAAGSAVQTSPLTSSLSTWAPCLQRLHHIS